MFTEADVNGNGWLDFEEFKTFSNLLKKRRENKYGGAYKLTELQLFNRF